MLHITIEPGEYWDSKNREFVYVKKQTLVMEHSLVSIHKWESKWHVPFYDDREKTREEILDYMKFMTITQNVDPAIYEVLSNENVEKIHEYIDDPMTAAWFSKNATTGGRTSEKVTSEIIYYWMITLNIPVEFQKWHINQLITLIRVCMAKNQPAKKMNPREALRQQAEINAARRKALNSKG